MGTPLDREHWQTIVREATPTYRAVEDVGWTSELYRRANEAAASAGHDLPTPIIIGIGIGGFIIVFCTLAAIGCYCARSRYRYPRNSRRYPDWEHGNTNVATALRLNPPPAIAQRREKPRRKSLWRSNSSFRPSNKRSIDSRDGFNSDSRTLSRYRFTGLMETWPLGGWAFAAPPRSRNQNQSQETSHLPDPTGSEYLSEMSSQPTEQHPPRTGMTKYGGVIVNDIGPAMRSTHSAKGSISSLRRPSLSRRSVSDDHLTSILRSTSQRLLDSQRPGRPRASSGISYASGPPPDLIPPLPSNDRMASREPLINHGEMVTYAPSVKSSVISVYSRAGSPAKIVKSQVNFGQSEVRPPSPASVASDDDSIYGEKSAGMIQAGLTSPNKKKKKTERHRIQVSTKAHSPNLMRQNSQSSMVSFGGGNVLSPETFSVDDPFVSGHSIPKATVTGASFQAQRRATFGLECVEFEGAPEPPPLGIVSGNARTPTKEPDVTPTSSPNPFTWSPQTAKILIDSQKPVGPKKKGHKRSQTVRVSGVPRPIGNVHTVQEEPETEPNSPCTPRFGRPSPTLQISSPGSDAVLSPPPSSRFPTSDPYFQPFLAVPPTKRSLDLSACRPPSQVSYPLSVYDYYSNVEIFNGKFASDQPESEHNMDERGHARNFSTENDGTSNPDDLPFEQPSQSRNSAILSPATTPHLSPPSHPESVNQSLVLVTADLQENKKITVNDKFPPSPPQSLDASPTRLSPSKSQNILKGPRPQPSGPPPGNSLASSVNQLRRTNSQLSTYAPVSTRFSGTFGGCRLDVEKRTSVLPPLPKEILEHTRHPSPNGDLKIERASPERRGSRQSVRIAETITEVESSSFGTMATSPSNSIPARNISFKRPNTASKANEDFSHSTSVFLQEDLPVSTNTLEYESARSSLESISSVASSLNLGLGLGLRLTGDGSRIGQRRRNDSMWGAESMKNSRAAGIGVIGDRRRVQEEVPPLPKMPPLNDKFVLPRSDATPVSQMSFARKSPKHRQQVPMWGDKWRRSLALYENQEFNSPGLYDKKGFLLSSPSTGPPPANSP